MAFTSKDDAEFEAHMRKMRGRMDKRTAGKKAYEAIVQKRLERGETITEHAHGKATKYSLAHPGPFMAGQTAGYLARHIASRHYGFGTRVTFGAARDTRRKAARIPAKKRAATSREIRSLVKHGYSPAYAARKAYREHARDPISRAEAQARLERRYLEQAERYPLTTKISLREYVKKNIDHVQKNGLLASYASRNPGKYASRDPGKLTGAKRRKLQKRSFALPSRRALPIENASHVRNAAARLAQMHKRGTITESEYKTAHARIRRAGRRFGVRVS